MSVTKKRNWARLLLLLLLPILLGSCSSGAPMNQRILVQNAGVDRTDEGYRLSINAFLADAAGGEEGGNISQTTFFSQPGLSVTNAMENIGRMTGRIPFFSHNQVLLIGADTAKDGIYDILGFFGDYFECRPGVEVFITEGTAEEAISCKSEDNTLSAKELNQLSRVGKNNGKVASVTVYEIGAALGQKNKAVCLPVLSVEKDKEGEAGHLMVSKTALLKDGKLVDYMTEEETMGMLFLTGNIYRAGLEITMEEGDVVTLAIMKSKTKVSCRVEDGKPEFTVSVVAEGEPVEKLFRNGYALDEDFYAELNDKCESVLISHMRKAIEKAAVKNHSDPFGFGDRLRQTYPDYWKVKEAEWGQLIAQSDFKLEVKANVKQIGQSLGGNL